MPWCPECKSEYREGFCICSDCGAALVEECPQEDTDDSPSLLLLKKSHNSLEIDRLTSILESNSIPVVQKFKGAGETLKPYMGTLTTTVFGMGIYVSPDHYPCAREIKDHFEAIEAADEIKNTEAQPVKSVKHKKKRWYIPDAITIIHLCYWLAVFIGSKMEYGEVSKFINITVITIFFFAFFTGFSILILIAVWYIIKLFIKLKDKESNGDLYNVFLCILINGLLLLLVAPVWYEDLMRSLSR